MNSKTDNIDSYTNMSAIAALREVHQKHMLLPDIQREFVWKYADIERLFESIVEGYPIGTFIIWSTSKNVINNNKPNLYFFIRDFELNKSQNEKTQEVFSDDSEYYIVLDGQQRITSLYIALYGSFSQYIGGRGHSFDDPQYWRKRELYYNLDFYSKINSDNPPKRFEFLTPEDSSSGNWYKVNKLLAYEDSEEFKNDLDKDDFTEESIEDLLVLFQRLNSSDNGSIIHYYKIIKDDYDDALDIFVRVNSTGKKLTKSDLLFSTLINGWKKGKNRVTSLLNSMNSKGDKFCFTRDYLMKLALVLVDADINLKISSLSEATIKSIRNNWNEIEQSAKTMVDVLVSIGISDATLTSYNATMPIAYYLYKGGSIKTKEDKKEVKKFITIAMTKRMFGAAGNTALTATRNALKQIKGFKTTPFRLSLFSETTLSGKTFQVTKAEIQYA